MKYTIDYGFGEATLYTPYDAKERFYALANTCFGIRKSIMHCVILKAEDIPCEDFERLEFGGDVYVWREDGARKMVAPLWAADKEWDMDNCEMVRYKPKEADNGKEYIDREEALSAIKQAFEKGEGPSLYIKRIPAADVVEVVRCRECKYWGDEAGELQRSDGVLFARCKVHNYLLDGRHTGWCPTENDFCSYGERKGGAD